MKTALLTALPLASLAVGLDLRQAEDELRGKCIRPPMVDSETLQKLVTLDDVLGYCKVLQGHADASEAKNRQVGSSGHEATNDYIYNTIKEMSDYWDVELQPFELRIQVRGNASLSINGDDVPVNVMSNSPSGSFEGVEVVKVDNVGCEQSDYPDTLQGKIALISRGECTFSSKSARAGVAGAVAALVYNNVEGELTSTLGGPDEIGPHVPTAGMTKAAGLAIVDLLGGSEPVTADYVVDTLIQDVKTNNVIATSKMGDRKNVLFLGAHSDSVAAGAGINDNGSGSAALLAVAKALPHFSVKNQVKIAWWSAEEEGLLGAEHYVETAKPKELQRIRLYLNYDMIASPNYVLAVYDGSGGAFNVTGPPGSAEAQALFEEFFKDQGFASVPSEFTGRSDYGPFLDAGVPCGGLFTGAEQNKTEEEAKLFGGEAGVAYDVNYHRVGDTFDNLNYEAFEINSKAVAHTCATYAASWEGFPDRLPQNPNKVKRSRSPHSHGHQKRDNSHRVSQSCDGAHGVVM